jgi:hypothetical protein
MDQRAFDRLATLLGRAASRRAGLRAAFGVLLGQSALPGVAAARGDAGRNGSSRPEGPCGNGSRKANVCTRDGQCCTNFCNMTLAKRNADGKGRCRCIRKGKSCTNDRQCCSGNCASGTCSPSGAATGQPCTPSEGCSNPNASCVSYGGTNAVGTFCLLPAGAACSTATDCATNGCVDGACLACSCGACDLLCVPAVCATCGQTTIQGAITAAAAGAVIDIAPGLYLENLVIDKPLTLRTCRPPGNQESAIIRNTAYANRTITVTNSAALDLIGIIVDGYHNQSTSDFGGGILTTSNLTLCGRSIVRNSGWDNGGGIDISANGATLIVTDGSAVRDNEAANGAGIHVVGESDVRIEGRARITGNTATDMGGGILAHNGANLTIAGNAVIDDNKAVNGGGIDHRRGISSRPYAIIVTDEAVISGNRATSGDGGGMSAKLYSSANYYDASLTIDGRARITGNSAGYDGGGLSICTIPTVIGGSAVVSGNTALAGPSGRGGAIWISGGLGGWPAPVTGLTITGSAAIRDNTAMKAGAVYMDDTDAVISASAAVSGNSATQEGGGFYLSPAPSGCAAGEPSTLTLSGAGTITTNTAASGGGVYSSDATNTLTAPSGSITGNTTDNCAGLGISC